MRRRLSVFVAAALVAAVAAVGALAAGAARTVDPGITARTITLGGTFPLSGPASSYAPIPVGMKVYFSYVNATRTKGQRGVLGRQIVWKYLDDGYNPANTVQQTRALVEQTKVFALVGGLGTEPQQAVEQYLNQNKVPQLFVSTGATEFGAQFGEFPWTIGWQPDYQAEGAIYGKYIAKNLGSKKIGIIYQNDSYGQDYVIGLKAGLGAKKSNIISEQGFDVTAPSVAQQVVALKAANPEIVCIFATPSPTIKTYATMKAVGFKPEQVIVNSVSATDTFMGLAVANSSADTVNGSISVGYVKDPKNPKYAKDAAVVLYKKLMAKYAPSADPNNGLYIYGMAKAYDTVQLLRQVGKNPTRAKLQAAWAHMNWTNPFLLPGVKVHTTANNHFPISQMKLLKYGNGLWQEVGDLINGRGV
jgi:ABC-type branched-subunit amino acid transport system substrate-binding protein